MGHWLKSDIGNDQIKNIKSKINMDLKVNYRKRLNQESAIHLLINTIFAPELDKLCAITLPIPREAPVTMAILFDKLNI